MRYVLPEAAAASIFAAIPASADHVGVGLTRNWATACDVKPEGAVRKRA